MGEPVKNKEKEESENDESRSCTTDSSWADAIREEPEETRASRRHRESLIDLADGISAAEKYLCNLESWERDELADDTQVREILKGLREQALAVKSTKPVDPWQIQPSTRLRHVLEESVVRLRSIELRSYDLKEAERPSIIMIDWLRQRSTLPDWQRSVSLRGDPTNGDIRADAAESIYDRVDTAGISQDFKTNLDAIRDLISGIELLREAVLLKASSYMPFQVYFELIQRRVQPAMDHLIRRAETGGDMKDELRQLFLLMNRLQSVLDRQTDTELVTRLGNLELSITASEYHPDAATPWGKHLDSFGDKSTVKFSPYSDKSPFSDGEREETLRGATTTRLRQIDVLAELYGARIHRRGPAGKMRSEKDLDRDEAQRKKMATQKGKRPVRLHSDADWARYLKRVYGGFLEFGIQEDKPDTIGMSPEDAYRETVEFVGRYLRAFTVHSPYNLEDFGANYLNRKFPRALTGQIIHDCGVYALRVAYMLSLLRDDLGLTFHFVRLPFHFALVILSNKGLPALVVNNDDLRWVPISMADKLVSEHGLSKGELAGELAGRHFIPGVKMPLLTQELKTRELGRSRIWSRYTALSAQSPFSAEASEEDRTKYLEYLGATLDAFNTEIYPVWHDELPQMWNRLLSDFRACEKAKTDRPKCETVLLDRFLSRAESAFANAQVAYWRAISASKGETFTQVAPKASDNSSKDARISHPEYFQADPATVSAMLAPISDQSSPIINSLIQILSVGFDRFRSDLASRRDIGLVDIRSIVPPFNHPQFRIEPMRR